MDTHPGLAWRSAKVVRLRKVPLQVLLFEPELATLTMCQACALWSGGMESPFTAAHVTTPELLLFSRVA